MREWLFTPTLRLERLADLNAWLETRCRELGKRHHPTLHERAIAEVFAEEQPCLAFDLLPPPLMAISSKPTGYLPLAW